MPSSHCQDQLQALPSQSLSLSLSLKREKKIAGNIRRCPLTCWSTPTSFGVKLLSPLVRPDVNAAGRVYFVSTRAITLFRARECTAVEHVSLPLTAPRCFSSPPCDTYACVSIRLPASMYARTLGRSKISKETQRCSSARQTRADSAKNSFFAAA